ncbi:MAG TPA: MFS transporter, partial [Puia sp.]|nr:MFS transporter [Puia sp.]
MKFKLPYKWELIVLLWLTFFFNQADRQVFNVVLPFIQADLGLTYAQLGLVASILTLVYGVLVPVAGLVGGRYNKKNIIVISLLVWSSATLLTGISMTLFELILLRSIATGGGEAFYSPPANALISEYHEKTRATALSIHQTALYAGIIFSGYIAGWVADRYGWRRSFFIFGGFGILLALVLYSRLRNAGRGRNAGPVPTGQKNIRETLLLFFKRPTAVLLTVAFSGMQFVGVGFITWMPIFLHRKFNFSMARAGFDATFYHHIAAFLGVLGGAAIADRLSRRFI